MSGPQKPRRRLFRGAKQRQQQLAQQLRREGYAEADRVTIPRRQDQASYPLSFAQRRLWFLCHMEPELSAYNIGELLQLQGDLRPAALQAALTELQGRHGVLRSRFRVEAGRPRQDQSAPPEHLPQWVDLGGLQAPAAAREARRLASRIVLQPFDLESQSMLRAVLLRLDDQRHLLVLVVHHISADGWSMGILVRELSTLYRAAVLGQAAGLTESSLDYCDYALWQRQWLQGERYQTQRDYWQEQLRDTTPLLLPSDRPRPPVISYRGAVQVRRLPEALRNAVQHLAQGQTAGTTPFMVLLAAFVALLQRFTEADDLCVGSPVAGRRHNQLAHLVGFFVNTLVLRLRCKPEQSLQQVLAEARRVTVKAYENQDLPFEKLVEEIAPERNMASAPLFQVLFALQNAPPGKLHLEGLDLSRVELDHPTSVSELGLHLVPDGETWMAVARYRSDLFDGSRITRLLAQFQRLLESAVSVPERPLAELSVLSRGEQHQVLVEWWDPSRQVSGRAEDRLGTVEQGLHALVELRARSQPHAVALVWGEQRISYGKLWQLASEVSASLGASGIGSEQRVAVLLPRQPQAVLAFLGVLQAGAAFVPLDPAYPAQRQQHVLRDSGARYLISDPSLASALGKLPERVEVLSIEQLLGASGPAPAEGESSAVIPATPVAAQRLAYVLYTSGSTGQPKGVALTHGSARSMVLWALQTFGQELRCVLASTSFCFDLSIFELYATLAYGGRVVLVDSALSLLQGQQPSHNQQAASAALELSLVNTVPSAAAQLLAQGALPPQLPSLNLAGETLHRRMVQGLLAGSSVQKVRNLYGPTEDTTYSTWELVRADEGREPTIGRPLPGTAVRVLDPRLRCQPLGVPGELCLSGAGLARGYLDQPALSAQRFVPDPFAEGSRLYRTGDLARFLADGRLELIGRLDHQVKLRGFRIELGEVEQALLQLTGVSEAAVTVADLGSGASGDGHENRLALAAHVVLAEGSEGRLQLEGQLRQRLPAHMVPSVWNVLPSLPRTNNGKLDRKRLHVPRGPLAEVVGGAEQSPLEGLVAAAFAEVLLLDSVPRQAHFFRLGGHSLLAVQLLSRLRELCGVELTMQQLFADPTVSALAAAVEQARTKAVPSERLPAIQRVSREGDLALTFAQERLWFLERLEPGTSAYNLSLSVRLRGLLQPTALHAALVALVRRQESLRLRFVEVSGEPRARLQAAVAMPLPMVDLTGIEPSSARVLAQQLGAATAERPFDLAAGPLMRFLLLRLRDEEHLFAATFHHIVTDGWSMQVFTRELATLYAAGLEGEPARLPALLVQYPDVAAWQRRTLADKALDQRLQWWRQELAGAPTTLALPLDFARPAEQRFSGDRVHRSLDVSSTAQLRRLCHRFGVTPFMLLLSLFQLLLSRWTGQRQLLVGTPHAGRNRREIEELIGFFVNTLVLRADLDGTPALAQLLQRTRERALAAFAHQELPFERLVGELEPQRDLGRTPLFQAFFNMVRFRSQRLELPDLQLEALPLGEVPAKFDLTLYVQDSGDRETQTAEAQESPVESPVESPGLQLVLVYNADLYTQQRMEAFLDSYQGLITELLQGPDSVAEESVDSLDLRHGLAGEGLPDPSADLNLPDPGGPTTLPALLQASVQAHTNAPAVFDTQHQWAYGQAGEQVQNLAASLRRLQVGPGQLVALHLPRDSRLVLAVCAVSQAGAAFLILDPAHPPRRLARCLREARPTAWMDLAGAPTELATAAAELGLKSWRWSEGSVAEEAADAEPLSASSSPTGEDDLAYVAFTSGSSGGPKAIRGSHRPAVDFVRTYTRHFGLGAEDRFALVSGLSHDPLLRDLWVPLALGARLDVPSQEVLAEPAAMWSWLREAQTSVLHLTPSRAEFLLAGAGEGEALPHLRLVLLCGEALTWSLAARLAEHAPQARLINGYGATETPQVVAWQEIDREQLRAHSVLRRDGLSVPVGTGRPGVQLLVLSGEGRPCAVGELGEVAVRTPFLALGYGGAGDQGDLDSRDIEEDSSPFASNPWRKHDPEDRIYRTGDMGRFLVGGDVQLAGRRDQQLKVRGLRVEPAEIEQALRRHPAIRDAAVAARGRPGTRSEDLVAYVAWRDRPDAQGDGHTEPLPDLGQIQTFLADYLPRNMLPGRLHPLDRLPLTANGKLDRQALPTPDRKTTSGLGRPPGSELERCLARLWAEVLDLDEVGAEDDFFVLGGHSLLATRLVASLRRELSVELPLRQLFRHPTVAAQARWIESEGANSLRPGLPALSANLEDLHQPFPLTEVQQAYWIGRSAGLELGQVATHSYLELDCPQLDLERFEKAFQELIQRHGMLRAVVLRDGRQRILEQVPDYRLRQQDLRRFDPAQREQTLAAWRDELSHQVLDPERWPLFDLRTSLLPGGITRLHISRDALVYDAWSMGLALRELAQLYRRPGSLPDPAGISFRDYVLAEEDLRRSEAYSRALEYWDQRLEVLPNAPELPLAREPGSLGRPSFERRRGGLEPHAWQRLQARARQAGVSPSAALLAAYSAVLATWSKSPHFCLNLTLFNRLPFHPEVEQLVGDFTSVTLLELDNRPSEGLEERARRVQERLWRDLDHRLVGGVTVMRRLARRQGGGPRARMPLVFTSTLGMGTAAENEGSEAEEGTAQRLGEAVFSITQTPQVWLDHQVGEGPQGLFYNWDFVQGLFPAGMVDSMFAAYGQLLQNLAASDEVLRESWWSQALPSLLPAEQNRQRLELNATQADLSEELPAEARDHRLLHQPFAAQAMARPDLPAVIGAEQVLSHGELSERSTQLASRLQQHLRSEQGRAGAGTSSSDVPMVAVCMERGWQQAVAVMAVLQAGAAYLPVDPQWPRQRRWYLVEETEATVVLTQEHLIGSLDWQAGQAVWSVDSRHGEPSPDGVVDAGPRALQRETQLAYVIFTSGSTGQPKGVMIDHRGALNTILDLNERMRVGPQDRVLALSSLSFDLSVYDLFGVLGAGGAVVLPEPEAQRDPRRWCQLMAEHRVSLWNTVPALLEMLLTFAESSRDEAREEALAALRGLRQVMLSGDWIPVSLPSRLRALAPQAQLTSLGGATEASIWSIAYAVGEVDPSWPSIPYGRPLRNQSFHVLDQSLDPRPHWVPGELYIGGVGLAQGYWRDPDKTRAAFLRHPSSGERLYRTGDLGRYLPDGEIEFLGREDFQVKVQGYRIELGEIESTLQRHPLVREVAVAAVGEQGSGRQLAAFVVPVQELPDPDDLQQQLRQHCAQHLPTYMLPARWQFLQSLPLSSNGKVDRARLSTVLGEQDEGPAYVAPRPGLEQQLAQVWLGLLGVSEVGAEDNFFTLGGDSVIAIRLAARLEEQGLSLSPLALFEHQTLRALADHLASHALPDAAAEAAPSAPGETTGQRARSGPDTAADSLPQRPDAVDVAGAGLQEEDLEGFLAELEE